MSSNTYLGIKRQQVNLKANEIVAKQKAEEQKARAASEANRLKVLEAYKDRESRERVANTRTAMMERHHKEKMEESRKLQEMRTEVELAATKINASKEIFLSTLNHGQRVTEKKLEHFHEVEIRNAEMHHQLMKDSNQYQHEVALKQMDNSIQTHLQELECRLKKHLQDQEHKHEERMQSRQLNNDLALCSEERRTLTQKISAETQAYLECSKEDLRAYEEKADIDKETRTHEALAYGFERMMDAKWKYWLEKRLSQLPNKEFIKQQEIEGILKSKSKEWNEDY